MKCQLLDLHQAEEIGVIIYVFAIFIILCFFRQPFNYGFI